MKRNLVSVLDDHYTSTQACVRPTVSTAIVAAYDPIPPPTLLAFTFSFSFSYSRSLSFSLFLLARYYLYVYFSLLLHLFFSFSLSPMTFFDRPSTANDDTVTTTMLSRSKNDTPEQQQHYQHDLSLETSQLMIRSPPEDNPEHQQPYKKFRQDPWSWDRLCSDTNSPLATLPLDVGIE